MPFVASDGQHASILTKPPAATPFQSHRRFLFKLPLWATNKGYEHD